MSHCLTHLPVLQWLSKNYLKHEEKFERKYSHCLHVNSDHFEDASINRPIFKYKLDYGSRFYIHLLLLKFITFNIILDVLARNRNYVMIILPRKADLEEDYDYD